jgi:DNA-binding MarR family transcriptional regulator
MGLNRQGVQRLVNEMIEDGLVETRPNPHHRRAHHIVLTKRGRDAYEAAARLQAPWVTDLVKGLSRDEIATALRVAATLRARLEQDLKREDGSE